MSNPETTYDVIIRVGSYTGHWDEQRQGFVIPIGYEDEADAERTAAYVREVIEVGVLARELEP